MARGYVPESPSAIDTSPPIVVELDTRPRWEAVGAALTGSHEERAPSVYRALLAGL